MTKKILSGVLAGVSMLSLSATAFAGGSTSSAPATSSTVSGATTINGISYDVSADLSFGEVNCVIPSAEAFSAAGAIVVNPFGAAVTTTFSGTDVNNTSFIASKIFEVKNEDTKNGLKVLTTVSVKKATGLVIVDGQAKEPDGWSKAVDKDGKTVRVDEVGEDGTTALNDYNTVFNPLISYDKIALTYKANMPKVAANIDKAVGGAMSAKQAMNTAVYVLGGTTAADLVLDDLTKATGTVSRVDVAAKGEKTGTLLVLGEKGNTTDGDAGYFTVRGDLNPSIDKENYKWAKENLSLTVVLKLIPVAKTAP